MAYGTFYKADSLAVDEDIALIPRVLLEWFKMQWTKVLVYMDLLVIFAGCSIPRRPKYIKWLGEDIIVHHSWVHRERSHQQNDVAATKEHGEYLQMKNDYLKTI